MNKEQTDSFIKWSTAVVESIEKVNEGLNDLKEIVFKHAEVNLASREALAKLIIQLGEETNVLSKSEVKILKEKT